VGGRAAGWLRRTELAFLIVGVLCAVVVLATTITSLRASRAAKGFGVPIVEAQSGDVRHIAVNTDADGARKAFVLGRLEIPRIGISVPILSDYEASSLLKGVGHVPGTAMPGGLGTIGLAGHRDTYFRPLRNIQTNMDIRVVNADGVYHYSVDSTEVVTPENVEVLDIRNRPELTLITCYPFYYVGAAPKRFIVHAHLVSALPDVR
jgi:sortase A